MEIEDKKEDKEGEGQKDTAQNKEVVCFNSEPAMHLNR